MKLRGTDFGPILNASGARGFDGKKYAHQKFLGPFGPNFTGCGFAAKTTTLPPNKGNMPMKKDCITPSELFPRCIVVNFWEAFILNALGLPGPGAEFLFETGRWQMRTEPFFISFMSIAATPEERIAELQEFVKMFARYLPGFRAPVGLQMSYSCSNVGLDLNCLVDEVIPGLKIASVLNIPLIPKLSVLTPVKAAKKISDDPNCDGLCVSNAIHWDDLPKVGIDRKKLFGSDISPLAEFGRGAFSGRHLLPLVIEWVHKAKWLYDIRKPINAGGGILCANDVSSLYQARADSVSIGSVVTLRSWRVEGIIRRAHQLF